MCYMTQTNKLHVNITTDAAWLWSVTQHCQSLRTKRASCILVTTGVVRNSVTTVIMYLREPFALLFYELVLIQVDEIYNWLPTDARIAVKPVCLLHTPVTKSTEQILAYQMPGSQQCILMPLNLPVPRISQICLYHPGCKTVLCCTSPCLKLNGNADPQHQRVCMHISAKGLCKPHV